MLTVDSVTPFLIERGLIDHSWIIGGNLTIRDAARRNRNIWVSGPNGKGLFLKQPDPTAEGGHATLRREAKFYRLCGELSSLAEVLRLLPRLIYDDFASAHMVCELIPETTSIRALMRDQVGQDIILGAVRAIGHALGTVHRIFGATSMSEGQQLMGITPKLSWVLSLHKPKPEILARLSAANLELLRIVQTERGNFDRLEALRGQWATSTVIHGDVKFDHFLIDRTSLTTAQACVRVWIVDWEMVGIGDPAWDLAGTLTDCLVDWISSMPISDGVSTQEMLDRATVPLDALRNLSRSIWSGYQAGANLAPAESDRFLLQAVKYSAARLIQSAFEISEEAERLSAQAVILLQLSANLLAEPELGQIQLYGIPLGSLVS